MMSEGALEIIGFVDQKQPWKHKGLQCVAWWNRCIRSSSREMPPLWFQLPWATTQSRQSHGTGAFGVWDNFFPSASLDSQNCVVSAPPHIVRLPKELYHASDYIIGVLWRVQGETWGSWPQSDMRSWPAALGWGWRWMGWQGPVSRCQCTHPMAEPQCLRLECLLGKGFVWTQQLVIPAISPSYFISQHTYC